MHEDAPEFKIDEHLMGYEKRHIEALIDPVRFDNLFEFANKLLLSKPVEYTPDRTPLSPDAQIVSKLGSRGIRTAYELANGIERVDSVRASDFLKDDQLDDEARPSYADSLRPSREGFLTKVDSPFYYPQLFSGELDRNAIARTEQFGEAMMDEMFKILGQDAYIMAERMKHATDDAEQIAVINWLNDRLNHLAATYEDNNTDLVDTFHNNPTALTQGFVYHPVRISGKIIGTYPEHQLSPTCLGISIAAAGFMKRASADTLHAGVMSSRADHRLNDTLGFIHLMPVIAEIEHGVTLPEKFIIRNNEGFQHLFNGMVVDVGYHDCVYVKLKSGAWMQFDPNFRRTVDMNFEDTNDGLTDAHAFLKEMHEVSPGLEITHELESFKSMGSRFKALIPEIRKDALPTPDKAKEVLTSIDPDAEAIPASLFGTFAAPAFMTENITSDEEKKSLSFIHDYLDRSLIHDDEPFLFEAFHGVLDTYVLDGMSIDAYLHRCRTDAAFLERAASDMRAIPFMMMAALSVNLLHADPKYLGVHSYVELGLPASRIGFATLSNVAEFHDVAPSPTFWLSNWPSLQPVTEAHYLEEVSEPQRNILHNNIGALLERELLYSMSYAKVTRIQSDDAANSKENSNAQEEAQRQENR